MLVTQNCFVPKDHSKEIHGGPTQHEGRFSIYQTEKAFSNNVSDKTKTYFHDSIHIIFSLIV